MPFCSSCGSSIPEGQGHSCSMCYGDPAWGHDGYYEAFLEQQRQEWEWLEWAEEQDQKDLGEEIRI